MLVPWKESYDKPQDHIKKKKKNKTDNNLADISSYSQTVFFPVNMYSCESWTIKKSKHQRIVLSNCGAGENS